MKCSWNIFHVSWKNENKKCRNCNSGSIWFLVTKSKTCLNWTSLGPIFAFGINRCSVYRGEINKDNVYEV